MVGVYVSWSAVITCSAGTAACSVLFHTPEDALQPGFAQGSLFACDTNLRCAWSLLGPQGPSSEPKLCRIEPATGCMNWAWPMQAQKMPDDVLE